MIIIIHSIHHRCNLNYPAHYLPGEHKVVQRRQRGRRGELGARRKQRHEQHRLQELPAPRLGLQFVSHIDDLLYVTQDAANTAQHARNKWKSTQTAWRRGTYHCRVR